MISKKILLLFVLLLSFLLHGSAQIKIVFRFDDFILNHYAFNDSLLAVFAKNNIPLNLAVIPYNTNDKPVFADTAHTNRLKRDVKTKKIDIQLHGFDHKNILAANEDKSEFKGLNVGAQYNKIAQGKHLLDSLLKIDIKSFIPPFNSYDNVTLKVLDSLHFAGISADRSGARNSSKITYLPFTYEGLCGIPKALQSNTDSTSVMVVMFHPYSFNGHPPPYSLEQTSFAQLDSLLGYLNEHHYKCYTFSEIIHGDSKKGYNALMENNKKCPIETKP